MSGINKVILIGNLGADPDVRYTQTGDCVANTRIATSSQWTDKQSGEKKEATEWHRVVFFKRLAEVVTQYLKKGHRVYIEGALKTRKWQDQNGQDRYTTEIVAQEMQMLGGETTRAAAEGFGGASRHPGENRDDTAGVRFGGPQRRHPVLTTMTEAIPVSNNDVLDLQEAARLLRMSPEGLRRLVVLSITSIARFGRKRFSNIPVGV